MKGDKITHCYSTAFKQKVITEIESGKLSVAEARKIYDIRGGATIRQWIKKYGKNHLLNKIVRVEMKHETGKIKELERQKRELESALAKLLLLIFCQLFSGRDSDN